MLWGAAGAGAAAATTAALAPEPAGAATVSDRAVATLVKRPGSSTRRRLVDLIDERVEAIAARVDALVRSRRHTTRLQRHGDDASSPRPAWPGPVIWVGSVVPQERRAGDVFMWEA
jgi:hypothetical protein